MHNVQQLFHRTNTGWYIDFWCVGMNLLQYIACNIIWQYKSFGTIEEADHYWG